jgi:LPXTG-motif cell wall-anchored protein
MRALAVAAVLFALLAAVADAHVTVIPSAARPGETRTLTFRVVNERSDATTVGVDLFIPAGVTAKAADRRGWTKVETGSQVRWTADTPADAISGEQSKDFEITAGPLPKADRLAFKALQHYSSGEVVRWIQEPSADADRPAPVLQLTATGGPQSAGGSSSPATGWAILAVLAAIALGGAALILRRRRRHR